jgi:hypothetical protein
MTLGPWTTAVPSIRPPSGHRLDEEAARVRRSGGFLSLALFKSMTPAAEAGGGLADMADRLRRAVRLEDVLAERANRLALLMPDTTATEAMRAAERLLKVVNPTGAAPMASAGLATAYGEVEGGGAALLAAAEEALNEAAPGQFVSSRTLRGRPRILVVDDDLTFAETLAETISERGWEAHPCTDVADARQRVGDSTYSGFFIDVVLPHLLRHRDPRRGHVHLPTPARRPHEWPGRRSGHGPGSPHAGAGDVHPEADVPGRPGVGPRDVPGPGAGHSPPRARALTRACYNALLVPCARSSTG